MLYKRVTQKFTYFCVNVAGWYDTDSSSTANALDFMGDSDFEWKGSGIKDNDVTFDGCTNRHSNSYTVFQLKTKKLSRLPIVDFKPKDYGKAWQQFGFELGPVCFS